MIWKFYIHLVRILILGAVSVVCGFIFFLKILSGVVRIIEWELIRLNSLTVCFVLIFDWISILFICFVTLISRRVIFYRGRYMCEDKNFNRFIYLVLAFVISIGFMVLRPNLIRILLGWDGLGLVSYALVIFYQNEKSANAGMLTVLSNRVGDVAILLGIGLIMNLGRWNFVAWAGYFDDKRWLLLKRLIMLAAITKSAQIPFSAWLPAAMAAPTPVSALVHSSTLVTAGVYLIIRFSSALEGSKVQSILLIISCLTMFMAGLGANFEYDLKKIIALSTLRQLGVILRILALGFPDLSFFHLLRHALFKALLFMCAGVVIHRVNGYQDIRYIGCLVKFMPLTVSYMTVANMALCGFPFLAGFYSKDMILEVAFIRWINFIALILYIFATGLTVIYTIRLVYYSLSGDYNLQSLSNIYDDKVIVNSMTGLGVRAVIIGCLLSWVIFPEPYIICLRVLIKSMVLIVRVLGGVIGYLFNFMNTTYILKSLNLYGYTVMFGSIWFIPFLRTKKIREIRLVNGIIYEKMADKGWYEHFGGQGMFYMFSKLFAVLRILQLNNVKVFIKMFMIRVVIVLLVFM